MYPEVWYEHNWLIKHLANKKALARLPALRGCVVDLGCGKRPFAKEISEYADIYFGVDWGNTLHGMSADVMADLNRELPFLNEVVDHVVMFEVLEHLAEPDRALEEAFRILRHGGSLNLSVPFQWWLHEPPWDYQRYTCYGLEYRLRKAGFSNIVVEPTTGFWAMWVLKLNYQLARLGRGKGVLRKTFRLVMIPLWWLNQSIALALDRVWHAPEETAGYFVVAEKT